MCKSLKRSARHSIVFIDQATVNKLCIILGSLPNSQTILGSVCLLMKVWETAFSLFLNDSTLSSSLEMGPSVCFALGSLKRVKFTEAAA